MPTHVLLTGAGFSRNWGAWLGVEVFEYLLGCQELDDTVRTHLWGLWRDSKKQKEKWKSHSCNFEDTLAHFQKRYRENPTTGEKPLRSLEAAILEMFRALNGSLAQCAFEPSSRSGSIGTPNERTIKYFLRQFSAIFTLNQDALLETHYISPERSIIPGIKEKPGENFCIPDSSGLFRAPNDGRQPYFKLHGSSHWRDADGQNLLIMGGNKEDAINHNPLLKRYHEQFKAWLSREEVRLMVIGYGFGDKHINEIMHKAVETGNLRFFILDPLGVGVLDNGSCHIKRGSLWPRIIGASRRNLMEIFGDDNTEHAKIMRFFEP